jgi:hypothetical protein
MYIESPSVGARYIGSSTEGWNGGNWDAIIGSLTNNNTNCFLPIREPLVDSDRIRICLNARLDSVNSSENLYVGTYLINCADLSDPAFDINDEGYLTLLGESTAQVYPESNIICATIDFVWNQGTAAACTKHLAISFRHGSNAASALYVSYVVQVVKV